MLFFCCAPHAATCQLYSSYWGANGGLVPGSAQLAICRTTNATCDQYASFASAQSWLSAAQDKDDNIEAMRSLSFLFNAFIMMQVADLRSVVRADARSAVRSEARPSHPPDAGCQ